jgi:hypothetical protein
MLRFLEWQKIDHVSPEGNVYAVYHEVSPALPVAFIPLKQAEPRAKFDQLLADHNVTIAKSAGRTLEATKLAVVIGTIANLLLCIWLWSGANIGILAIISISTAIGFGAGLTLDHCRKLTKLPKMMPVMQEEPPK